LVIVQLLWHSENKSWVTQLCSNSQMRVIVWVNYHCHSITSELSSSFRYKWITIVISLQVIYFQYLECQSSGYMIWLFCLNWQDIVYYFWRFMILSIDTLVLRCHSVMKCFYLQFHLLNVSKILVTFFPLF
jgi:hypothetical protein